MQKYKNLNLEQLKLCAKSIAEMLLPNSNYALLFSASLGAGKTTLIQMILYNLGLINTRISSPTFLGHNFYELGSRKIWHFDLYQVGVSLEELDEILNQDSGYLLCIEWAENLSQNHLDLIKRKTNLINIVIEIAKDDTRDLFLTQTSL